MLESSQQLNISLRSHSRLHSIEGRVPKCVVEMETLVGYDEFFFSRSEFHRERCIRVTRILCMIACKLKRVCGSDRLPMRV
jgi:hypothetical protein